MDRFWKWLMRMDARGIFVVALLLLLLVSGWWTWVAFRPKDGSQAAPVAEEPLKLPPFRDLGVLSFVSNQLSAAALIVPVNPFRPTFESMVSNQADRAIQDWRAHHGSWRSTRNPLDPPDGELPRIRIRPPQGRTPEAGEGGPTPPPTLTYRGMFQRPDGLIAAYVHDSARGAGRFVEVGDVLYGVEVVAAHKAGISLKLPGGEVRTLARGDAVTLGEETP